MLRAHLAAWLTVAGIGSFGSHALDLRPPPAGIPQASFQAPFTILGTVSDRAGTPIPDASVSIAGTTVAVGTDSLGAFSFTFEADALGADSLILRATRIGYAPAEELVRLEGDSARVDFALAAATVNIDSLVLDAPHVVTEGIMLPFRVNRVSGEQLSVPSALGSIQGATVGLRTNLNPRGGGEQLEAARVVGAAERMARMSAGGAPPPSPPPSDPLAHLRAAGERWNTESYDRIAENPFLDPEGNPLSTFSIDVDRASYANVRRYLTQGQLPPPDAVRIEELVNYFPYSDAPPERRSEHPFAIHTEFGLAPWNPEHRLLRIALKGETIDLSEAPPNNLVFLLDVSGSMRPANKLPLLKRAFGLLVEQLRPEDRVAIAVYAGAAGLILPSTPGADKEAILQALEQLEAGGSTAGGAGIKLAYRIAEEGFVEGGNNRVILATDGDFNIGVSSDAEMIRLIEEKRESGVFLTVLGFGTGNLKDSKMEKLADHGNGNFAYVDGLAEARKVFVEELGGTLHTIAKDVKIQIEFNPARVAAYRLIGYENRLLAAEDFDDDTKDAGELGAGHSVTALYEIVPVSRTDTSLARPVPELRYQEGTRLTGAARRNELAHLRLRYKAPNGEKSRLIESVVRDQTETTTSEDFHFSAAVAAFGMLLRGSQHLGEVTGDEVMRWAEQGLGEDPSGHRTGFLALVECYLALDEGAGAGGSP